LIAAAGCSPFVSGAWPFNGPCDEVPFRGAGGATSTATGSTTASPPGTTAASVARGGATA
jgi:hypothetical protein